MKFGKGIFFIFSVGAFCVLLTAVAGQAHAEGQNLNINTDGYQEVSAHQSDPVEDTIMRQLAAIKSRDAGKAFSLISESMHSKYKNPKNFLGHMRFEFRTLYNHTDYRFLDRHNVDNGTIQKVQVTTMDNEPVLVIFKLKETDAGSWLIDSFTIIGTGETQPI